MCDRLTDQGLRAVARIAACALALGFAPAARAATPLTGQVLDADGHPARRATVFIYTAGVRTGTSVYCPSCYPDCRKSAVTDGDGRFTIAALDDSLLFRILVVAKGWDPVFVPRVDPSAGPAELRLAHKRRAKLDPGRSLSGRVLDPRGRPVVGATLKPYGYRRIESDGRYTMRFGSITGGPDPLALTDQDGRFALALGDSGVLWYITVHARDLAPMQLHEQPASTAPITVRMVHGATVSGRLLHDGRPLPGVSVGLGQAQRAAQFMAYGWEEIATDERGVFTFVNVTAGEDYLLYGKMETLHDLGALDTVRVRSPGEDSLVTMGNLAIGPGRRVSGTVTLADGKPLPPGIRLLLGLDANADAKRVTLGEDGRFEFRGVPPGDAFLVLRVPGYRLASQSTGFRNDYGMRECRLGGDRDVTQLSLVLEPEGAR